jgi:hydrogenase expression/formation protein HypC
MCLAYPMKIDGVFGDVAQVSLGKIKARVSLQLMDGVKKGDYVLVHTGMAIEKVNSQKAGEILKLISDLNQVLDREDDVLKR